jgi:hypothetical protein
MALQPHTHSRSLFYPLLAAAGLGTAGCVAALGPGYTIEKQEVRVHFLPDPQPRILLEADYHLRNTGNRPLSSLELRLPGRRRFHLGSGHADWDGAELTFENEPSTPRETLLNFPAPWQVSARHVLHLSAEIAPPSSGENNLSFTADAFFLPAQGWSPELLPAEGLFSTGGVPPRRWDLVLRVPENFIVHSSGRITKTSRDRGELLIRATQSPQDHYPFVVAGRYLSTSLDSAGQKVFFGTRASQNAVNLGPTTESPMRAIQSFNSDFGVRTQTSQPLWIVECPAVEGCFSRRDSAYAKLVGATDEPASAEMISMDAVVADVSGGAPKLAGNVAPSLAASWLGYGQNPGYFEQGPPLYALPAFAASAGREAVEGPTVREETIRRILRVVPPKPQKVEPHKVEDPAVLRAKSLLFFYALQERYGQDNFGKALRHMLEARHGRGFNLDDLISAFEQETHQNVAEFVRLWMKHPGVPDEFRARHEDASTAAATATAPNIPKEDVP